MFRICLPIPVHAPPELLEDIVHALLIALVLSDAALAAGVEHLAENILQRVVRLSLWLLPLLAALRLRFIFRFGLRPTAA
jgi:hypothetical protein